MADKPERWLPVTGWADLYEVSPHGRLRSQDRIATYVRSDGHAVTRQLQAEILRQSYHKQRGGYTSVGLHRDGIQVTAFVHRLVCEAFYGADSGRMDVAHCDGNPRNNCPENLRWATRRQNMDDTIAYGTRAWGERHGAAKLTLQQVQKIRASHDGSQRELAQRFGIYQSCISNIRAGRRWAHAGGLQ
jgi:hypothetical protein